MKSTEVLVGDIVHIEAGDILTCDGVVIDMQHELRIDESDATGESDAIQKVPLGGKGRKESDKKDRKDKNEDGGGGGGGGDDDKDSFLLSGSKVLEGKGHYLALAVGQRSFQGKIFMSLRASQPDETRMQKQLSQLAERIAKLASIAGGVLFLALFVRNCVQLKVDPNRTPAVKVQGFIQSFVISVTLVVVAVPEGELPAAR